MSSPVFADSRNSTAELQGLDATTSVGASNPATRSPISPGNESNPIDKTEAEIKDEVNEIDKLLKRVEELEAKLNS